MGSHRGKEGGEVKRSGTIERRSALARRTRLRPMSEKRRAMLDERRAFVASVLQERPRCEAGEPIGTCDGKHRCARDSVDVHEVKTRARGGSILDADNVIAVCRRCHDWIHANPAASLRLGLLASSWSVRGA